jgi:glutamine synthetase
MGHDPLPASLHDAIRSMEDSELMPQILGEQVFEHFLRNKRAEWQDYRLQVTPYELQRNLGIL